MPVVFLRWDTYHTLQDSFTSFRPPEAQRVRCTHACTSLSLSPPRHTTQPSTHTHTEDRAATLSHEKAYVRFPPPCLPPALPPCFRPSFHPFCPSPLSLATLSLVTYRSMATVDVRRPAGLCTAVLTVWCVGRVGCYTYATDNV